MAVGEAYLPQVYPITGVKLATVEAGVRSPGRKDLVIFECAETANIAGVFTRNAFCAAPVHVARQHLANLDKSTKKYLLVNTGNANAGTGDQGMKDALETCRALGDLTGVPGENIFPFSTGVIGEHLPVERITAAIPACLEKFGDDWELAAKGIMTTDTRPKVASCKLEISGKTVSITGIAKGAGMIKPDMATMLAFVATDANIDEQVLQTLAKQMADCSFNRITVDGDTSTNDAAMLIASGQGGFDYASASLQEKQLFNDALAKVYIELAQGLVKDGEGASKFITVDVEQGINEQECLQVAYTIAESPLVKTALFASDPNWGRLLAAIGRAGLEDLDVTKVSLYLGEVLIAENGCRAVSYSEEAGQQVMDDEEITIRVQLNRGKASAKVWTTDLSHDYVIINAEYRT